jgi:signal transduction histidine kinase
MKKVICISFLQVFLGMTAWSQDQTVVLDTTMFESHQRLFLSPLDGWLFKQGNIKNASDSDLNVSDWEPFNPTQLSTEIEDASGRVEGWFRLRFKLDKTFENTQLFIDRKLWAATDVFIDGELIYSFGKTGIDEQGFESYKPEGKLPIPLDLKTEKEYLLAIHVVHYEHVFMLRELRLKPDNLKSFINLHGPEYFEQAHQASKSTLAYAYSTIAISSLLMLFFWILVLRNANEKIFRYIALLSSLIFFYAILHFFNHLIDADYKTRVYIGLIWSMTGPLFSIVDIMILELIIKKKIKYLAIGILIFFPVSSAIAHMYDKSQFFTVVNTIMLGYFGYLVLSSGKAISTELKAIIIGLVVNIAGLMAWVGLHKYYYETFLVLDNPIMAISVLSIPISLMAYVSIRFNNTLKEVKDKAYRLVELSEEKKEILANQNLRLEKKVAARTEDLNKSLENLKSTQNQLIHSEKMASLGELTAGIAHEIQNPLNFVNNFSELNKELIEELKDAVAKNDQEEVQAILKDLLENETKIAHHGKRAEEIVKSMLQHSRTGNSEKELTDINALADEYLRLAYHGLRAKDKSFNAEFKTELDPSLPKINVIPQDIGRVLLNLINNAFQAVSQHPSHHDVSFDKLRMTSNKDNQSPLVVVSTKKLKDAIQISVTDNGSGIPEEIKDKIFQPFFTTKATGEGTGLGLSMSHEIITKGHNGTIAIASKAGQGAEFTITLPAL